jgi:hypothetical protein
MRQTYHSWLDDLRDRTYRAALQIGLPLLVLALLPVLGLLIWDFGSATVRLETAGDWLGAAGAGGIGLVCAVAIYLFREEGRAWISHSVVVGSAGLLLHDGPSWLAITFAGYAIGVLLLDAVYLWRERGGNADRQRKDDAGRPAGQNR